MIKKLSMKPAVTQEKENGVQDDLKAAGTIVSQKAIRNKLDLNHLRFYTSNQKLKHLCVKTKIKEHKDVFLKYVGKSESRINDKIKQKIFGSDSSCYGQKDRL